MLRLSQSFLIASVVVCAIATTTATATAASIGPNWIGNETLVVARIGDSNRFAAYSKFSGKWVTYEFPADVRVTPVAGTTHVSFAVEGKRVTEIVAVDRQGIWRARKLIGGAAQKCIPVVGQNVAAYRIGDQNYAFSGLMGVWDTIDGATAASVSEDTAMIVANDRISVFSAQTGAWAESPVLVLKE